MKNNWQIKKLGELCRIELGKTPYRDNPKFWDTEKNTDNIWLSIADLLNTDGNVVSDSKEYISDEGVKLSKIVKKGTLLASFKLTLGRLAFAGRDLYTNEAIAALCINDEKKLSKDFLYHYLSFFDWHAAVKGDVKIKGKTLNKAKLKEIEILYPASLPEQQRIVRVLDEVFEGIGKAKVNAEKNLANARELFESYLQGVFGTTDKRRLTQIKKKLGDVCEVIAGQSPEGKYYNKIGKGLPFYQGKKEFAEKFIGEPTTWTTEITKEAQAGDILMSVRAPVGPINFATEKICIGRGLAAIRATKLIDKEFLFSSLLKHESKIVGNTGAVFNSISKTQIENIEIILPPLPEQRAIVAKLDALSGQTKKLAAIYRQKLAGLEELQKARLRQAFAGEL